MNCSCGVRNTVSISRSRCRLMLASWNSNSKSDTARSPRTTTVPSCWRAKSTVRPGIALHLDVRQVGSTARQLDALVEREHRRLVGVGGDRDDHAVEDAGGAAHQVLVAVGDRIEGARVDGVAFHAGCGGCRAGSRAQQMIPDLAGLLRLERLPAGRQRRQPLARRAFDIDERPGREPAAPLRAAAPHRASRSAPKGGSRNTTSNGVGRAGQVLERVARATAAPCACHSSSRRLQLARGGRVLLDEAHVRGAARQRFEPERAAAGEQVEAARAVHARRRAS